MNTLKGKVTAVLTLVTVLAFIISWFLVSSIMKERLISDAIDKLSRHTAAITQVIEDNGYSAFQRNLQQWSDIFGSRISIINQDGRVILDSATDAETLDNHKGRPEIRQATKEGLGSTTRYSHSLKAYMVYLARKFFFNDKTYFIRMAYPLTTLKETIFQAKLQFLSYIIIIAFLIIMVGFWIVRRFFTPLERIIATAHTISEDKDVRFPLMADPELQRLSESLQTMSSRLKNALEDLGKERDTLSRIIAALPVGVILLDNDNRLRYSNTIAQTLLGIRTTMTPGQPIERFLTLAELYPLLQEAKEGKEQTIKAEMPEQEGRHLSIYARQTGSGPLLVIADLTEEIRLEQARRDFIADAGHELQTPLTTIRATAEFLQEEYEQNEEIGRYLDSIIHQQERMTSLVDDLLLLSRLESEPPSEKEEELDLSRLLQSLTEEGRNHPLAEYISIQTDLPERALIMGRAQDLSRAIRNILDNAIKYVREKFGTEKGGEISVSLSHQEGWWILQIEDNGIGISQETAAFIFERFRRGDSHRARGQWGSGGYGLGLAIAKRILTAHGGNIALVTANGEKTLFEIKLPTQKN
ncbi:MULTISPECIES: ATP-binding protein [Aminobacterium]|jgi:two-component system phosphate regulon sensor histidine kinase PhoR|uniref:ATP-binding protein n=1 Tax=Aminobacterium TaxID=81466 RepID=UPI002579CBFA|nr:MULTISPECIES: ATP-binding protein [unclassified Aminobacterium]